MLQNTSQGHKAQANPTCDQEPSTTPRTTDQQQAMIKTQNLANNRPPPLLTLPTQHTTATTTYLCHQLIITPHPLRNISPPIRLPSHCTLIPHHSMLSFIQPAHPQPLLNPLILFKHLHSHHKHIILLFPASSSYLNPTPHTSIPRMGTSKGHNCE